MDLVYFALLCSVLIFVHELGHFFWAKAFGVKVLTFSIGFGPKLVRLRGRETEYCVGILPLGGFVKMLEENRQEPVMPEERHRTFDAQPIWRRFVIVTAGPAMNVLFPVLLYFGVFLQDDRHGPPTVGVVLPGHPADGKLVPGDRILEVNGERISTFTELSAHVGASPGRELTLRVFRGNAYEDVRVTPREVRVRRSLGIVDSVGEIGVRPHRPAAAIGVLRPDSPAYRAGLRTFDVVTEIRGRPIKTWEDIEAAIRDNRGETIPVTYLRPTRVAGAVGGLIDVGVFDSGVAALTPDPTPGPTTLRTGIEPASLFVAQLREGSPEHAAGLRVGDRLLEVDGEELPTWSTFAERLLSAPDQPHDLVFSRGGQRLVGRIERLRRVEWADEEGRTQSRVRLEAKAWEPTLPEPWVDDAPVAQMAFRNALRETFDVIRFILVGIWRILQGEVSLSTLGGPISVYDVVGTESGKGPSYFVWAMAVISINLGLVNLLPIPVLDGGHLLFMAFEAVLRRPLPLRVREIASLAGLVLLLSLMGIAIKNDVERRWDTLRGQVDDLREQTGTR